MASAGRFRMPLMIRNFRVFVSICDSGGSSLKVSCSPQYPPRRSRAGLALDAGIAPIARVPNGDYAIATQALDDGALGEPDAPGRLLWTEGSMIRQRCRSGPGA